MLVVNIQIGFDWIGSAKMYSCPTLGGPKASCMHFMSGIYVNS